MASPTTFRSPYEIRVQLVADTIAADAKLAKSDPTALAVRVLDALQAIPEKVR